LGRIDEIACARHGGTAGPAHQLNVLRFESRCVETGANVHGHKGYGHRRSQIGMGLQEPDNSG
jgi:hypothetical protein